MEIYLETYKSNEVYEEKKADFQHFLGHGLVRFALDDYFKAQGWDNCQKIHRTSWASMLAYGSAGKPYLKDYADRHFNLSHTEGLLACAVSDREVGIDAERIRHFSPAILRRLTQNERDFIESALEPELAFIQVWTMKEAYIKLMGEGIAAFDRVECVPQEPMDGVIYRQFIWQGKYVITAMTWAKSTDREERYR